MEREFLENLMREMPEEVANAILDRHSRELEAVRFENALSQAILKAGGRNEKAIGALLDREALLGHADREAAIGEALAELKKSCGYLFESPVPPLYAPGTGAAPTEPQAPQSLAAALRERFERK